jgi:helicase SWR1
MLKKANQKRRLDDLIMQEGDFTTDYFAKTDLREMLGEEVISGLDIRERASVSATPAPSDAAVEEKRVQEALAAAEDEEDAAAAKQAYQDIELDAPDFGPDEGPSGETNDADREDRSATPGVIPADEGDGDDDEGESDEEDEDEAGAIDEYMLSYVDYEWHDYFSSWKGKRLR